MPKANRKWPTIFLEKAAITPLEQRKELVEKACRRSSITKQCVLLELDRSSLDYQPVAKTAGNLAIMRQLDRYCPAAPFNALYCRLLLITGLGYHINRKRLRRLMLLRG